MRMRACFAQLRHRSSLSLSALALRTPHSALYFQSENENESVLRTVPSPLFALRSRSPHCIFRARMRACFAQFRHRSPLSALRSSLSLSALYFQSENENESVLRTVPSPLFALRTPHCIFRARMRMRACFAQFRHGSSLSLFALGTVFSERE